MSEVTVAPQVGPKSEWTAEPAGDLLHESIPEVLARQARDRADRPALYWLDGGELRSMSWAELAAVVGDVARALAGQAQPGDRVATWTRNAVNAVIFEYASAAAGTILTPFNTAWTDPEVTHAWELTTPTRLFVGTDNYGASLVERAASLVGAANVIDLAQLVPWAASVHAGELPAVTPDDSFLIQFTSGTTGHAKGALISQRAALNCAYQRNRAEVILDHDCYLNPVPYHHVGGSCSVLLGGVADGGAVVVLEKWVPEDVVRVLNEGIVTRVGGVPTMMIDLCERLAEGGQEYGIASVSVGGAQVPEYLIHTAREMFGAPVINTYAQSESPMITTTRSDDPPEVISTTVGRPAAGVDLRIVDPVTGDIVPRGVAGEILVRSPYVMQGYWDMPEQTASALTHDGYLRTGDLASMDDAGNISFRGRERDVIIRGGENIYPAEVEDQLAQHPGVATSVIVGLDDKRLGEQVVCVVMRKPGSEVTGEELADYLTGRVARFKIPVTWRFVEEFPMTASGKIRRFMVRDEVNASEITS